MDITLSWGLGGFYREEVVLSWLCFLGIIAEPMRLAWGTILNHSPGILLAFCLACGGASSDSGSGQASDSGDSAAVGEDLYILHCSACHGSEAEGGDEGPELSHTSHKEDEQIIQVILEGKGSMQPVDVTESEAQLIVDHLRVLFPPD